MTPDQDRLYHFTRAEYLESIRADGLLPGAAAGVENTYVEGGDIVSGDNEYLYLWNEQSKNMWVNRISDGGGPWDADETVLLAVDVPDDHHIERDYDMLLYGLEEDNKEEWCEQRVEPYLEELGVTFTGPVTDDNIIDHVDAVGTERWDEIAGSYRTPDPIPPDRIEEIPLPDGTDQPS